MKGIIIAAALLLIYIVFLIWYYGSGKPLSNEEVEQYISIIEKRAGGPNAATNSATANLRKFGLEDDGKQFFMVSMEKYTINLNTKMVIAVYRARMPINAMQ